MKASRIILYEGVDFNFESRSSNNGHHDLYVTLPNGHTYQGVVVLKGSKERIKSRLNVLPITLDRLDSTTIAQELERVGNLGFANAYLTETGN